jgi:hypothetical protein
MAFPICHREALAGKSSDHDVCLGNLAHVNVRQIGAMDVFTQISAICLDRIRPDIVSPHDIVAGLDEPEVQTARASE